MDELGFFHFRYAGIAEARCFQTGMKRNGEPWEPMPSFSPRLST